MWSTPVGNYSSSCTSMDDAREAIEQNSRGSYYAINFLGQHWLVMIDAYSKYPCIYPTTSVSTQTTVNLLEDSFTHFGYPHTIVSDNATTFTSEVFQQYCKERDIVHLTGAPYHPATNGAAERLIRTFKEALRKSSKPPKQA